MVWRMFHLTRYSEGRSLYDCMAERVQNVADSYNRPEDVARHDRQHNEFFHVMLFALLIEIVILKFP